MFNCILTSKYYACNTCARVDTIIIVLLAQSLMT